MDRYLIDTNGLLRYAASQSEEVRQAIRRLTRSGATICVAAQVLIEFWAVATRPVEANGLGWSVEDTHRQLVRALSEFDLLADVSGIFPQWLRLVRSYQTKGKQVHDARLVAVMLTHGVENLLTFNVDDFRRYQEIKAVHPADVK